MNTKVTLDPNNPWFRHVEGNVEAAIPAVAVQTVDEFKLSVMKGYYPMFEIIKTDDPIFPVHFVHDPEELHFFANRQIVVSDKTQCGPRIENIEGFTQKFHAMETFVKYTEDLLSKPFMLRLNLAARRSSGHSRFISRDTVIVTIYPQHPDIHDQLYEAISNAKQNFKSGEKFAVELNFASIIQDWYIGVLKRTSGETGWHMYAVQKQPFRLTLTNHSGRIDFCSHDCCLVFGLFLCPIYCFSWAAYRLYRYKTCKTHEVEVTGLVAYGKGVTIPFEDDIKITAVTDPVIENKNSQGTENL